MTPLRPGDQLGGMKLVPGGNAPATSVFEYCDPVVLDPGTYERSCQVPAVRNLHIGTGPFFEPDRVEEGWNDQDWKLWLDGRPVDLGQFGTYDIPIDKYEPLGGEPAVVRNWNVLLLDPTAGSHKLRYLLTFKQSGAKLDMTWIFTMSGS